MLFYKEERQRQRVQLMAGQGKRQASQYDTPCICGHREGDHTINGRCTLCDCMMFQAKRRE